MHYAKNKGLKKEGDMNRVERICIRTGVTLERLQERTQRQAIVIRRHIIMHYFLQKGWNYKEVAGLFGLDRTTANHAEKKVNELIYTKYPAWAYEIYLTVNSKPPLQDELFGISKETIECVASM
jgi:hypothetical protein